MVQVSRRTGFTGSALIRLLAQLSDTGVPESKQAFADRLSQWVSWTDAISLAGALDGNPAAAPAGSQVPLSAEESECARARATLVHAIAAPMDLAADFSPYRQRYLSRQQAMEASVGPLRERLRARLAAGSPAMGRLAAVDAVMEQALGVHEHRLLSTVPSLLEKHFKRLRKADETARGDAEAPVEPGGATQPGAWLDVFRKDMQSVLLAELDVRFQPVEGLLEALRVS
ncbi:DUF3348 domain-containing protein [Variovorax sp. J2P1-59]|uniref:DUF3348 domain-containing protein n=1 Tax=Variovorax flavidus TaxID=3053501 RepID=UPI0025756E18|nr:DUF3348 domain-containing protein [Variovorax sp. J2P1-59]MDM0078921.1 DUF3348 domain-containing protein [Variovorax sp. J2P1-59]